MGLNPMKWKTRNLAYGLVALIFLYIFVLHKWTYHITQEGILKNAKAENVWEFVADFSNMLKLNTVIEDFHIVDESGDFNHWKYSVRYTEHLIHIPFIKHSALAHFSVIPHESGYFLLNSEHTTCFFSNIGCLKSMSQFKFEQIKDDTKCTESVQFQCPLLFSWFCHMEATKQRQEIMYNLKEHFVNIRNK